MLIDLLSLFVFEVAGEKKDENENDEIKITIGSKHRTKKRLEKEKKGDSIICLF